VVGRTDQFYHFESTREKKVERGCRKRETGIPRRVEDHCKQADTPGRSTRQFYPQLLENHRLAICTDTRPVRPLAHPRPPANGEGDGGQQKLASMGDGAQASPPPVRLQADATVETLGAIDLRSGQQTTLQQAKPHARRRQRGPFAVRRRKGLVSPGSLKFGARIGDCSSPAASLAPHSVSGESGRTPAPLLRWTAEPRSRASHVSPARLIRPESRPHCDGDSPSHRKGKSM